jgi:hypothetical protein
MKWHRKIYFYGGQKQFDDYEKYFNAYTKDKIKIINHKKERGVDLI